MEPLKPGMLVAGVNEVSLGLLARVNACCLMVQVGGAGLAELALKFEAIFNVTFGRVTLVCNNDEVARYRCGVHSSDSVARSA